MAAVKTFNSIVQQVQASNLNYHLQLTPFAANISLKKTNIKDRFGRPIQTEVVPHVDSNHETEALHAQKYKLENELANVKREFASTVHEHEKLLNDIRATIKSEESDKQELVECKAAIDNLLKENEKLKVTALNKESEIKDLESSIKIKTEVAEKLNKNLKEVKEKFKQEKAEILVNHKTEVKSWRKKLGEETKSKITLRKKLEDMEIGDTALKNENIKLKEELAVKDDELGEALKENVKLEEKLNSLLDVLYGCPQCGLNSCECNFSVEEDDAEPKVRINMWDNF